MTSVGTVSVNGVQVAEIESFEFTPKVETPVAVPNLGRGSFYHSITLPVQMRVDMMGAPLRPLPRLRWVHRGNHLVCMLRRREVGIVLGAFAMCGTDGGRRLINRRQGRRRCESKRWVERAVSEAWYREQMSRRWYVAMGFQVEGEK